MYTRRFWNLLVYVRALLFVATIGITARQSRDDRRRQRFAHTGDVENETPGNNGRPPRATEAPTGFDGLTNGMDPQGPAFETLNEDNVVGGRSFNENRFIFEEVETAADGLQRPELP